MWFMPICHACGFDADEVGAMAGDDGKLTSLGADDECHATDKMMYQHRTVMWQANAAHHVRISCTAI